MLPTDPREASRAALEASGVPVFAPSPAHCTDNGLMVACAGAMHMKYEVETGQVGEAFSRGNLVSWR